MGTVCAGLCRRQVATLTGSSTAKSANISKVQGMLIDRRKRQAGRKRDHAMPALQLLKLTEHDETHGEA